MAHYVRSLPNMGAFGIVVLLIYVLVVGWFGSFITPLIIMAPIPLTLIGSLPGHAILGTFFTATSMIGFIALWELWFKVNSVGGSQSGNSRGRIPRGRRAQGRRSAIQADYVNGVGVGRGASVIYLDPIFQGLAVSLIFGVIASTALTLVIIPLLYFIYLKYAGTESLMDSEEQ